MSSPRSPTYRVPCLQEGNLSGMGRWLWPALFMLLLLFIDAGCSRPRKPSEEVDWGQPRHAVAPRKPPQMPRSEPAAGEKSRGSAGEEQHNGSGTGSDGGNAVEGSPDEAAALPARGVGEVAGADRGGTDGESDTPPPSELERPAPALPGREPGKPAHSAAEAAESAKQLLKRAQQLLRNKDESGAAQAAIEAYDQALPHAASDAECKKLCGQLEAVLAAAGRTQGRAEAVPTRFE